MRFVLDNSVSMRWLFEDGSPSDIKYADKVLDVLSDGGAIVPVVWALEVTNVLVRSERAGVVSTQKSDAFLKTLSALPIDTDLESPTRAFTEGLAIARRFKLSAYDASYLELSLRLDIPFATLDDGLRKAARKASVNLLT